MSNYINFLVQLTERDKRLLIALFIILIILFVVVAYIGQGIRALMKNYAKDIDGYMHELCSAKLVDNPKDFRKQVFLRETKTLYRNTRWVFRVFVVAMIAFVTYTLIAKPGGANTPFAYVGDNIKDLWFDFNWPKGEFFGIKKFPIDWPYLAHTPSVKFTFPSIVSYIMLIVWIATVACLFGSTLRFIARLNRARVKSVEVFSRSLDDANFSEENKSL